MDWLMILTLVNAAALVAVVSTIGFRQHGVSGDVSLRNILNDVAARLQREEENEEIKNLREKISQIQQLLDTDAESALIIEAMVAFLDHHLATTILLLHERRSLQRKIEQMQSQIEQMQSQIEKMEKSHEAEIRTVREQIQSKSEKMEKEQDKVREDYRILHEKCDLHFLLWSHRRRASHLAEFNRHFHNLLAKSLKEQNFTVMETLKQENDIMKPWENGPMHKRVSQQLANFAVASNTEISVTDWDLSVAVQEMRHKLCHDEEVRKLNGIGLRREAARVLSALESSEGAEKYKAVRRFLPMFKTVLTVLKHCA